MPANYQFITFERKDDIFCVRLARLRVEDKHMQDLGAELTKLIDEENCRKMVLNLGPDDPQCLVSVFLAKLINLQRKLEKLGGVLALANLSENTRTLFGAAGVEKLFRFFPDQEAAVEALKTNR